MLHLDGDVGDVRSDGGIVIASGVLPGDVDDVESVQPGQVLGVFVPHHRGGPFDRFYEFGIVGFPGLATIWFERRVIRRHRIHSIGNLRCFEEQGVVT